MEPEPTSRLELEPEPARVHPDPTGPPAFIERSALLRQLFFDRRFRWAAGALAVVAIAVAAMVPRYFRVTPAGVEPVFRVSGVDFLQAWSFARTARQLAAAGRNTAAAEAWWVTLANQPAEPDYLRGLLRTAIAQEPPDRVWLTNGFRQGRWLLRLTRTNQADLDLVARLLRRHDLNEEVVELLSPLEPGLASEPAATLLAALLDQGRPERFEAHWRRLPDRVRTNAELRLYHAAWAAGWGPPGPGREGRRELAAAAEVSATGILASRLQLRVSEAGGDLETFGSALRRLVDRHQDRFQDHATHWRLLSRVGRREEAAVLARAYSRPPASAADCAAMVEALTQLGLVESAEEYLGRHLRTFESRSDLWVRRAELLVRLRRWEDLRLLAADLRLSRVHAGRLSGYAWFLQGYSEYRRGLVAAADESFRRAVESPMAEPLLAYHAGAELSRLGYGDLAARLFANLEQQYGGLAQYWFQVQVAAYRARQIDVLLAAAEKARQLEPGNRAYRNNLAAALLILRERPADAVQLTLGLLAERPADSGARLNHALALLQNDRVEDAVAALAPVVPEALDGLERSMAYLARFEIDLRQGRLAAAREDYPRIELRHLMPAQIRWLDAAYQRLERESDPGVPRP